MSKNKGREEKERKVKDSTEIINCENQGAVAFLH
jgi:hypothetical protein